MKIIIDTTQEKLFILLMNNNFETIDSYLKSEVKKSDILSELISEMLTKNETKMGEVESIYVTTGPGSFMGNRAGLIFARTIGQVSNIDVYQATSFDLISCGMPGNYLIDAKGGKAYWGKIDESGKLEIELIDAEDNKFSSPMYKEIISDPKLVVDRFKKVKDFSKLSPLYVKEPRIGGN